MLRIVFVALGLMSATQSFANSCPTQQDITDGVVLSREGGVFISGFRQVRPGLIEELRLDDKYREIRGIRTEYVSGIVAVKRTTEKKEITFVLKEQPDHIIPADTGETTLLSGMFLENGIERAPFLISITNVGQNNVTIGPCKYKTTIVDQVTEIAEGAIVIAFRQFFSRELGIVVKSQKLDGAISRTPVSEVKYDHIFRKALGRPM